MNKRITVLYVIIGNNEVVGFGNLKETVSMFQEEYKDARNYAYYYRQFKKSNKFTIGNYSFERLI